MLKIRINNISNSSILIKKSELNNGPREVIQDTIMTTGMKSVQGSAYLADNSTDKITLLAEKTANIVNKGTALADSESAGTLSKIVYKTTKDIAGADTVCNKLYIISGVHESVTPSCSIFKIILFRGQIYLGAKITSKRCMAFQNACAGEGC